MPSVPSEATAQSHPVPLGSGGAVPSNHLLGRCLLPAGGLHARQGKDRLHEVLAPTEQATSPSAIKLTYGGLGFFKKCYANQMAKRISIELKILQQWEISCERAAFSAFYFRQQDQGTNCCVWPDVSCPGTSPCMHKGRAVCRHAEYYSLDTLKWKRSLNLGTVFTKKKIQLPCAPVLTMQRKQRGKFSHPDVGM